MPKPVNNVSIASMHSENLDSRILDLDKEVIEQLAEIGAERNLTSFSALEELVEELPEAMSKREIAELAGKIQRTVPDLWWVQRRVSRDAIFHMASTAAFKKHDLVTAENSANFLRRRGVMGVIGSLMLRKAVRDISKDIIAEIQEPSE